MFENIFIEKEVLESRYTQNIISKLPNTNIIEIDNIYDYWGRSKKPYLQKRDKLNLFVGNKKGSMVKKAPDAYGISGEEHFYFIHSYNCIYECQYCYLQGYFNTPDMVFYVNHQDIIEQMENIIANNDESVWFHAGEYSDSLALSHITGELDLYHQLFKKHPNHYLELRTKSVNISELKKLEPLENIITSFSLSPNEVAKEIDLKTPPTKTRIKAMSALEKLGHPLGIHFDPIYYFPDFESAYKGLIQDLKSQIDISKVRYFSLGVVRFTKDVYSEFEQNYPNSPLLSSDMKKSFDGKIRYPRPMRMWMMNKIKQLLLDSGVAESKIYLCMENDSQ